MKRTLILHILVWGLLGYAEYFAYPDGRTLEANVFFITRMLLFIGLFYANALFIFDYLFRKKTVVKGLLYFLASAAVFTFIFYHLFTYFYFDAYAERLKGMEGQFPRIARDPSTVWKALIGILVIYFVLLFFASLFYWLYRRVRVTSAAAEKAEKERLKEENEKIRMQNMFLRSQINPHFLHNTLNFLYAKSLPLSPELSDGILTLSNIMRYSLQHEEDELGMVLLDKELEHVQNVVAIHQMRFSNSLQIDLAVTGDTEGVKVIPLVFITLLENAFKHGVTTDAHDPLRIRLDVNRETIRFSTGNRKRKGPKEISHGIGIENIRQRLAYVYKSGYRFHVEETEVYYNMEVILPVYPLRSQTNQPS